MNFKSLYLIGLSTVAGSLWSQQASDALFDKKLRPNAPQMNRFSPDESSFLNVKNAGDAWFIYRSSIQTGDSLDLVFNSANYQAQFPESWKGKMPRETFELSEDGRFLIVQYASEAIYRHSRSVLCFVVDLKQEKLTLIPSRLRYPTLDPTGTRLAYVKDNNLCIFDLAQQSETLVTQDGAFNRIINGAVDWVYEEEFSMSQGFAWSPSGRYISFYRFDESAVRQFGMDEYHKSSYPDRTEWKYPKAGEDNAQVQIGLFDTKTSQTHFPALGSENDQYLPRMQWGASDELLSVQRLNRWQNHWELLGIDPGNPQQIRLLTEEHDEAYVDIHDNLYFLPHIDGKASQQLIYSSEKSGYHHLYLLNYQTGKEQALTFGMSEVGRVMAYNAERNELFYTSIDNALEDVLMAVSLPAKKGQYVAGKTRLVSHFSYQWTGSSIERQYANEGSEPNRGSHYISMGPKGRYYYDGFSNLSETPIYAWSLNSVDGSFVKELEHNDTWTQAMIQWGLGRVAFDQVPGADGTPLNRYTIYPPEFDPSQQYPVLMFCYGGPGANTVKNAYGSRNFLWHQYLAKQGYIVSSTDNRGTGRRGAAFKKSTYLKLGELECKDQTAVAEWWKAQSYVNPERIGIWGWSFGGYLSSLCLSKSPETFSMAIAVAPVTHWKYYDNIYTERYLRRPMDNPDGYEQNSPLNFAHQITGKYLIVHGTADDNVHFQNSVEMVNALIAGGIDFDSEYYPNRNHSIGDATASKHLFNRLTAFVLENL